MRYLLQFSAAALAGALLLQQGLATPPPGKLGKLVEQPKAETCGDYGTSVEFEKTPSDAARKALKEEKLVLVLHISGHFEDPNLTWNNAEALRVNALANPKVGEYLNKYFVSAFQKVATFKIVGKQKQGGNVAAYFCAPDGRVLHIVAGPVNANTMLNEAKWVVDTTYDALKKAKSDGAEFKAIFRKAHAERLRQTYGVKVIPITYDPPVEQDPKSALTYKDPTGRPLAPKLPPPPIKSPDVKLNYLQVAAQSEAGARAFKCGVGGPVFLGNQGIVHRLMAAHSMRKIEEVYGAVFEGILGERITTDPVVIVHPFPWVKNRKN